MSNVESLIEDNDSFISKNLKLIDDALIENGFALNYDYKKDDLFEIGLPDKQKLIKSLSKNFKVVHESVDKDGPYIVVKVISEKEKEEINKAKIINDVKSKIDKDPEFARKLNELLKE